MGLTEAPAPAGETLEPTAPGRQPGAAARALALGLVVALVSGLAVWLISPRFELDTPSLVDDWGAISRSPDQMRDVLLLRNPETQRYRPGWVLWNWVQWHTLDAPRGMVGPNFWNVLRAVVLVAGLTLLTWLLLPPPRGRLGVLLHAVLAAVPAFLVVTVPTFVVDLARFGPQEPLLVGGMALGAALLLLAARRLGDPDRPVARVPTMLLAVAGCAFWALGVYQKETSLAVVPLLAAALYVARKRRSDWRRLGSRRRLGLGLLATAVALPLAHVFVESLRIVLRGDLIYEAEVDAGKTAAEGLVEHWDWLHEALPREGRLAALAAVVLVALVAVLRRRIDPLAVGALLSGVLALALAGQSGVVATRYYIPAYALFALALALSLARLPAPVQAAGAAALVLAFVPPTAAQDQVRWWVDHESAESSVVQAVEELDGSGCVVAEMGLGLEAHHALPVLVGLEDRSDDAACREGGTYFLVGIDRDETSLVRACEKGTLEPEVVAGEFLALYRCGQLGDDPVSDPVYGTVEPERLVQLRRFPDELPDE